MHKVTLLDANSDEGDRKYAENLVFKIFHDTSVLKYFFLPVRSSSLQSTCHVSENIWQS